ncbi:MAG TPA: cytoplasmic protein [Desulfobulbaceae bacterium]|nr:cytoplasmic protein [Desulfobulbaceae bacterium]
MTRVVFFAFRSDPLCFMHAILNAIDLEENGMWGEIVVEGEATRLIPEMARPDHFLNRLYLQAKQRGMIYGACLACATKMGVAEAVAAEDILLIGDMSGHPPMATFIKQEYTVITI